MTDDRIKTALAAAIATRGPRRGHLKVSCPPMGSDAAIAWQAAMMIVNPYKVSIGQLMFLSDDQRAFFDAMTVHIEGKLNRDRMRLDRDRMRIEMMGAW